ncbi:DinB family protein [Micropruina sonneratiae]|uniref:DinB family protein n=1 Tax=Micropruina sonneratiae TaxID=2986940 RepID=UPI002226535B|nr:DinB family protein [Micropruina sp. KQZ13P-5]MCW3156666.1 DinB family protein [Micropruina sp. KQZ13P-5]
MQLGSDPAPPAPPADGKDWTWVIERPCPECGWTPTPAGEVAARTLATVPRWTAVLARPDVARRGHPAVWSALEYGCHVRDVCRTFGERLELMLDAESPAFADWDQDAAAVAGRYHAQDPATVAREYAVAAGRTAGLFAGVRAEQWPRRGTRSNGSEFTVATLGSYLLHDLEHHLADVAG